MRELALGLPYTLPDAPRRPRNASADGPIESLVPARGNRPGEAPRHLLPERRDGRCRVRGRDGVLPAGPGGPAGAGPGGHQPERERPDARDRLRGVAGGGGGQRTRGGRGPRRPPPPPRPPGPGGPPPPAGPTAPGSCPPA